MNENIYAILSRGFPQNADTPFLILPDNEQYSYRQLEQESARYANVLVACGLEPGDRVAVQVDKSPAALFLYLGCVRAGLAYVPINPGYQCDEVEYFLKDADVSVFICRPDFLEDARKLQWNSEESWTFDLGIDNTGSLIEAVRKQPDTFSTAQNAADDLAAIMYTSGTTGRSKGTMLSHRNLSSNALVLHSYWEFVPGDVILHMLPIYHTHGLFVATHCAMLNGSPLLFEPRFDAKRALRLMPKATVLMGVPPNYAALLNESGLTPETCEQMRLFISGSAPLLPTTFEEFRRRSGHAILERYGMTEGGMLVSNPTNGERRCGTVGFPLPGTQARIVDDQGRPVAADVIGHIQVKGENLFSGYWRMPEKTRDEFTPDDYFKTGDVGHYDRDGYLTIVGRFKDVITVDNREVYPKSIETAIDLMPGVAESAVIGLSDRANGITVAAVIAYRQHGPRPTAEGITSTLKESFDDFQVPGAVYFVDQLPRNGMGKVQKSVLRERYQDPINR
ncbi:AMP-binding protein [Sedimenticola hydrogenitrophicus]|uniref:AMP-binding protein n=1 Tax=Sedimenticola hydrogenitrophicus TaxID=2967975 RepID=UPI0023B01383|nr:AMP-binding protein [Sedimenticola hydrogenitrophicus]